MAKAVPTAIPAADRFKDFLPEEVASAVQIAAKLAYLHKENLIFVDGFITGAIMAQSQEKEV